MIRVVRSGGFVPPRRDHPPELSPGFAAACRAFGRELADDHEIVGEHGGGDEQGEALGTFGAATLHAAAAHQHRDASLDHLAVILPISGWMSLFTIAGILCTDEPRVAFRLSGARPAIWCTSSTRRAS